MAVTTERSVQLAQIEDAPYKVLNPHEWSGKLRIQRFTFTQGAAAGDATSIARLVKLPPGAVRIMLALSRIAYSAFGASRVLDIGFQAYTGQDGVAVNAAPAAFRDDIDVSSAGNATLVGVVGGDETYLLQSRDGVTIHATVAGGTIPAAATLKGYIIYEMD